MMLFRNRRETFFSIILTVLFSFTGCVDSTEPNFDFKEGVIFVDSFVSTTPGASFATITETAVEFGKFVNNFIDGATVSFRNTDSNQIVQLTEQEGTYLPPDNFVAAVGDSWELLIELPNGKSYQSSPETLKSPVDILDIKATYNPEFLFRDSENDFLPGHFISVDINDPVDQENFYFWSYRSFEKLKYCEICGNSIFRNGECQTNPQENDDDYIFNYLCDSPCWKIRFNQNIKLFTDEFTNGTTINNLPVADILFNSKENIVVHLQQFSLSAEAYQYFRVLKDIVDNNGNLNAPPPAGLIGNIFNPSDSEEFVLGRFTGASTTMRTIFIDRTDITELPVDPEIFTAFEKCTMICPSEFCPPIASIPSCEPISFAPCTETRFKTAITPEGWIN